MKKLFCYCLLISLFLLPNLIASGQNKSSFLGGIGFPELINAGAKFRVLDQASASLTIGWWPPSRSGLISWDNLFSFSGDLYFHFGAVSELSDLRPWYTRIGISFITGINEEGFWGTGIRFGRDFYITENNGYSLDLGIVLNLNPEATGMNPLLPAIGGSYFFK